MLIAILNIYNPLNNIKFIEEKKKWKKIYLILDFFKVKYHTKKEKKKKKDKDNSFHSLKSKATYQKKKR